jgi:hypothetical protein
VGYQTAASPIVYLEKEYGSTHIRPLTSQVNVTTGQWEQGSQELKDFGPFTQDFKVEDFPPLQPVRY